MITGLPVIYGIRQFEEEATPSCALGTRGYTSDGRIFRYAKAGEALTAGLVLQAPGEVTNHQGLTPTAAVAGSTSVTVTLGATAATENLYAEGYLLVTTTPGNGIYYRIKGHQAAALSSSLTLQLSDPVKVAITTASRIDLVKNPYSKVVAYPETGFTSSPVGVACLAMTSGYFGWIQTGGPGMVKADADGAVTVGKKLVTSNATAGCVENCADGAESALIDIGDALTGIASVEYGMAMLRIDN